MIGEIIAASHKPPVIVQGAPKPEKPQKKVHFQKNIPKGENISRRSAGVEASRISSVHGRKKAQEVVMHLIENTVSAKELEEMCRYIIPGQYEDLCLERCLAGVCGYPLCSVPYQDKYGKKEVIFRNNKVYDISRRRNYCSDVCFEASASVRDQISFTPHYLREHETWEELVVVVPDSSQLKGRRGDLKDIGGDSEFSASTRKMRQERLRQSSRPQSSTGTVEEAALAGLLAGEAGTTATAEQKGDVEQQHSNQDNRMTETLTTQNITTVQPQSHSTKVDASQNVTENGGDVDNSMKHIKKNKKKRKPRNNPEILSDGKCDPSKLEDRGAANKSNNSNSDVSLTTSLDSQQITPTVSDNTQCNAKINESTEYSDDTTTRDIVREGSTATRKEALVRQVEEYLLEWLTWDSYVLVLGENFLQGLLERHGIMSNHRTEQQPNFESALDSEVCRLRYWRLCSQLARQERLEELEAASVAVETRPRPSKDAPDMETLRQDVQKMALKVKCFLSGREEPELEDLPPEEGEKERRNEELPLVDRYEQRGWRRKVFFENVNKAEGVMVAGLSLSGEEVRPLLSRIVASLNLTAHNLYLRPPQWTLVLLVLLKLLGVRSPTISSALTDFKLAQVEVGPRLATLGLSPNYLDTLISTLLNDNTIMSKFMEGAVHGAAQPNPFENESTSSHRDYSAIEELD